MEADRILKYAIGAIVGAVIFGSLFAKQIEQGYGAISLVGAALGVLAIHLWLRRSE